MHEIEDIPREKFIDQVVIPYFYGNLYKDIVVIVYDLEGRIVFTNHRYAEFYELALDKIIGNTFIDISKNINISAAVAKKIDAVRQSVIQKQKEVKYVLFFLLHDTNLKQK